MMDNNYGYIVHIGSVLSFVGVAGFSDYCASKSAVVTFAESLRSELMAAGKGGITVTCVCPYHIKETGLFGSVKTRLPWLLPPLRVKEVVDRVIRAVREKQFLVVIPRHFYFTAFFKRYKNNVTGTYITYESLSLSVHVALHQPKPWMNC